MSHKHNKTVASRGEYVIVERKVLEDMMENVRALRDVVAAKVPGRMVEDE